MRKYKKELIFKPNKPHKVLVKNYQATSKCGCCKNMNKNYVVNKEDISLPVIADPLDGETIKYSVGGLRSKSYEYTKELV